MKARPSPYFGFVFALFIVTVLLSSNLRAQTATGSLRGQVVDPSGAVVPGATVTLTSPDAQPIVVNANGQGIYEIKGLATGKYTVSASAKGFQSDPLPEQEITGGQLQKLDIQLSIAVKQEQVMVDEETPTVDVSSSANASAVVIKGKDLEALSDDPDELQSELQALAGPAAGPNGGQVYIDGFTGGQLPPKASIREIRINQNPFSAQYDKLGYGRIEVLTKPGSDKFHGQVFFSENNSIFNSLNPLVTQEPDYHTEQFSGNVSGPINKKASFFFNVERRNAKDVSVVNATILDSNLNIQALNQGVLAPRTRTNLSPRIDYQLTPTNTLTARYQVEESDDKNNGIGGFNLLTQATNDSSSEHTLQLSDTQILNAKMVNETRFQLLRERNDSRAILGSSPTLSVSGAFTSGGSSAGIAIDHTNHYELQNYTSMAMGTHFVRFGGRLRASREVSQSTGGFNGGFTFSSLSAYQKTLQDLAKNWTPAQIRADGGGSSQFSITAGQPVIHDNWVDAGLYAEDDWRLRPNFTLSYGLRFETQSSIHDHADFAPRVGMAWAIGRGKNTPKTVLRAGIGVFYDRFNQNLVLQSERANGANQQQIIVASPDFFPTVPSLDSLRSMATSQPTRYQIDPTLHAPYTIQSAVTVERQITKTSTISVTYQNARGVHQFFLNNINAPRDGSLPFGNVGNIYEYRSEGIFKQNQLLSNLNMRIGSKLSLFGFYTLSYANSNTAGASSFPSDQYNLAADYGRSSFDVRHRLFLGGNIALPYGFRLNPFLVAQSGAPFNITVGKDLNGDSRFNDRPTFASGATAGTAIVSPWGTFDPTYVPGNRPVPVNLGSGPAVYTLNLRVSKSVGLGKAVEGVAGDRSNRQGGGHGGPGPGGGGPGGGPGGGGRGPGGGFGGGGEGRGGGGFGATTNHRYSLTFSAAARNLLNHADYAPEVGNINSPKFGQSNGLIGQIFNNSSANRRIDLQVAFSF